MSTQYLIEIGSIKCRITPILPERVLEKIDHELSYTPEDAMFSNVPFSTRVKLFQTKRQLFYTGLLSRVESILKDFELDYIVQDTREKLSFDLNKFPKQGETKFREYQIQAQLAALEHRGGVIQLPTGAGKTLTLAGLISQIGAEPTIFYVPKTELLYQTKAAYEKFFGTTIGVIGDSQLDLQPITIATVQTVSRKIRAGKELEQRKNKFSDLTRARKRGVSLTQAQQEFLKDLEDNPDKLHMDQRDSSFLEWLRMAHMYIIDECHHTPADTIQEICFFHRDACFKFGTSATPFRDDGEDLKIEAALGTCVYKITVEELIEQGYLVPPKVYFYNVLPNIKTSALEKKTYPSIYQANIVEHDQRNQQVLKCAKKFEEWGKTTLVLVNKIEHGKILSDLFHEEGLHTYFIQGAMDSKTRRNLLDQLLAKQVSNLICTSQIGSEGLDVPTLDAVINAAGGKSSIQTLQRAGRALRTSPGKTEAFIIDFIDNVKHLKSHSNKRKKMYESVFNKERIFLIKNKL